MTGLPISGDNVNSSTPLLSDVGGGSSDVSAIHVKPGIKTSSGTIATIEKSDGAARDIFATFSDQAVKSGEYNIGHTAAVAITGFIGGTIGVGLAVSLAIPGALLYGAYKVVKFVAGIFSGDKKVPTQPINLKSEIGQLRIKMGHSSNGSDWKNIPSWSEKPQSDTITNVKGQVVIGVKSLAEAYKNTLDKSPPKDDAKIFVSNEREMFTKIDGILQELEYLESQKKPLDADKALKKIEEKFLACLEKMGVDKKVFKSELAKARGKNSPTELTNELTLTDGTKMKETSKQLDVSFGREYLRQKQGLNPDKPFERQIDFMAGGRSSDPGLRTSQLRKEDEAQGMTINGQKHSVLDAQGKPLASVMRSGAFAVHNMKGPGVHGLKEKLDGLKEILKNSQGKSKAEVEKSYALVEKGLKKLGIFKENDYQFQESFAAGDAMLAKRRDLVVAQALPKIVASVGDMINNPASMKMAEKTGSFLHVEESFLSHLDDHEKAMTEDMKGAMDYLRENAVIRFDESIRPGGQPIIELENPDDPNSKIIIKYPKPEGYTGDQTEFGLKSLFFTTGVNEFQTLGQLFKPHDKLQNAINKDGLNELAKYTQKAVEGSPADKAAILKNWKELREHYTEGTTRAAKDMNGVDLRTKMVETLSGGKGVVCKSGKDRTGGQVSRTLARQVAKDESTAEELRKKLCEGISYRVTGINTGKKNAYAFNSFQQQFIPAEILPPKHLLGNVAS